MTAKTDLQKQIQGLQEQAFHCKKDSKKLELEFEIDRIARTVIEAPLMLDDRHAMLTDLLRIRAQLVHHFLVNGIKDTCLFLNPIQNIPPSPLCPAYNKMAFPTISTYHKIGSNIACFRLDPKALEHVPKAVLEKTSSLEGKEVDLLWTAIDGRFYDQRSRSLNHSSHAWAHRHALPGPEKILVQGKELNHPDSNTSFDVNMGIFPEVGLEKSHELGAIAFDHLSPMNVHVHARSKIKAPNSGDMLYSPDNAHFRVILGSPFSIDWSVMQKDQRIAITKRLIIFDYDHPICKALLQTIRDCDSLETHLQRLTNVPSAIEKTFAPVIKAFEDDNPDAMKLFHELPPAFQYGVYREAWVSFDSPYGIHGDFGRASFEKDGNLDVKYHCNNVRRAEAVHRLSTRLEHLLVESQFDLLFRSQSLVKGDNVLTMMKCAQLFYKEPKQALVEFGNLPKHEQEAIYFAYWEIKGCPRIDGFSTNRFHNEGKHEAKQKAQAVLLAASRQPHLFTKPIIEKIATDELEEKTDLNPIQDVNVPHLVQQENNEDQLSSLETSDNLYDTPSPALKKDEAIADCEIPLQERVSSEIMNLVFDSGFQSLDYSTKATRVNKILSPLEKNLRDTIYNSVYHNSRDPGKGGPSWGELHIADDLEVLVNSIQEAFGTT